MIYTTDLHECVLTPHETEITLDAILFDSEYTLFSNSDGYYVTQFIPATSYDHQRLAEHLESAKVLVEQRSGYWSHKNVRCEAERKTGVFAATQSFAPKVDPIPDNRVFENCQQVSLRCFLNDDQSGQIYLNISYLDVYSPTNGIDADDYGTAPDDSDFDW